MEVKQQHASSLSNPGDGGVGDEGATEGGWEVELGSQRDAALAIARELSYQLDHQKETLERRAKTAEALRDSSARTWREFLDKRTRRNQAPRLLRERLAGLVGGSISAWLLCAALGLAWLPRASLALGIPCTILMTLLMTTVCSRGIGRPKTKR